MNLLVIRKALPKLTKLTPLYSLVCRQKFRRATQDGLTRYNYEDFDHQSGSYNFSRLSHKTNAEELMSKIPPIEVDDNVALCYGVNDYGWGHPVEYITLNTRNIFKPSKCKYCGLRFVKKEHEEHH